jgi:hypothetical protein
LYYKLIKVKECSRVVWLLSPAPESCGKYGGLKSKIKKEKKR